MNQPAPIEEVPVMDAPDKDIEDVGSVVNPVAPAEEVKADMNA